MEKLSKITIYRIIGTILVLIGFFMMISNYNSISPEDRDTDDMKKISAQIIDKTTREEANPSGEGAKKIYELSVQYRFETGQKFFKNMAVDESYYNKLYKGDSILIYADQQNPYHIVIPDSRDTPVSIFNKTFFLSLILIAAGAGVWMYSGKLKTA